MRVEWNIKTRVLRVDSLFYRLVGCSSTSWGWTDCWLSASSPTEHSVVVNIGEDNFGPIGYFQWRQLAYFLATSEHTTPEELLLYMFDILSAADPVANFNTSANVLAAGISVSMDD